MSSELNPPSPVAAEAVVLPYASKPVDDIERSKKSLRRVLLLGGILLVVVAAYFVVMWSTELVDLITAAAVAFAGFCALWLRRQVRLERRRMILVGAYIIWGYLLVFGCLVTTGIIIGAVMVGTMFERFLMIGVLGSLGLMMELGLGGVAWGLTRLSKRLKLIEKEAR